MSKETRTETVEAAEEAFTKLSSKTSSWLDKHEAGDGERSGKMTGFNRVVLAGNLTRDPSIRELPSGTKVADMGLAVNESYKTKAGETAEKVCFVDIVAWGRQAEVCEQYLRKGSAILIEGKLQFDRWQTKTGDNRSKLLVRTDNIKFLSRSKDGGTASKNAEPEPELAAANAGVPF